MEKQTLATLAASIENWRAPEVPADIPHGDMPGDKVEINQGHIQKANLIFPLLVPLAVGVFVVAWIFQFIGHKLEGKKPSFFEDIQYLWVGPLFVLSKLLERLHIRW